MTMKVILVSVVYFLIYVAGVSVYRRLKYRKLYRIEQQRLAQDPPREVA